LSRADQLSLAIFLGIAGFFLSACSVVPSQETVNSVIRSYFEERQYRVVELQLGAISPVPLSQKTYMGTQGHIVEIRQITLEVREDNREYRKGEKLSFINASIRIREKIDKKGGWIVVNISGIQVP
jgi:hypothetical protein